VKLGVYEKSTLARNFFLARPSKVSYDTQARDWSSRRTQKPDLDMATLTLTTSLTTKAATAAWSSCVLSEQGLTGYPMHVEAGSFAAIRQENAKDPRRRPT
jgi:hypothetical protein